MRFFRFRAALAALFFVLLVLCAGAPHEHGQPVSRYDAAGLSLAASPSASCPICDWLAAPRLSAPPPVLAPTIVAASAPASVAVQPVLRPAPAARSRSRAPPIFPA